MNDPSIEAKPGDILYGKNNKNIFGIKPHFIIFLGDDTCSKDQFLGAMLTSSKKYSNISLKESHFEQYDLNGNEWQVYYKLSYICPEMYYKKKNWRPFKQVGQLSKEGLKFVLDKIGSMEPIHSPLNKK